MRMTRGFLRATAVLLVALAACSARPSRGVVATSAQQPGPQLEIAYGCPEAAVPEPDFTFTPRLRDPQSSAPVARPPRLDALPRLAENVGCTRPGRALEAGGRPTRPALATASVTRPKRGPKASRPPAAKAAPAAGAEAKARAPAAAPRPSPAAPAKPSTRAEPAGAPVRESAKKASAPAPAAAPEPAADTAAGAEVAEAPFVPPEPCPPAPPPEPPDATDSHADWGLATYLSNDDTMSLSSAQRIIFAIDGFLPLPPQHLRRHELLNYFSFETAPVRPSDDFSVLGGIAPKPGEPNVYTLALSVRGRSVERAARRNLALTLLVDRSGSMREEGKMTFLKQGLRRMLGELKTGDVINLVTFNTAACVPLQSFVVGRDDPKTLTRAIDDIRPQGNTDLGTGLLRAYQLAESSHHPAYNNRVLLITDALANTGETDPEQIATVSRHYDRRHIRLSGIGVGKEFDDRLLDRLTDRGKGAYVFLGSKAEVDAVFGSRFVSLVETTALDTHFLLHLPPSLRMNVFYGEESSTSREEVQPIHYFAGTSQLFLADLMAKKGKLREGDMIMLGIEHGHPETGARRVEEHAFRLGDLARDSRNVRKARLVIELVAGLEQMAARVPQNAKARAAAGGWLDDEAVAACSTREAQLAELARGLGDDREARRVLELWTRYCQRFARSPAAAAPAQGWPGAKPTP